MADCTFSKYLCPCVSSRCDARLSLGRLHLLPERGGASGPQDVCAGHPAGPAPRVGPRLWSHGGGGVRHLLWYDTTSASHSHKSEKYSTVTYSFPPVCFAGAAATFRGIGMASLVILLIFSFIQYLTAENEDKGRSFSVFLLADKATFLFLILQTFLYK